MCVCEWNPKASRVPGLILYYQIQGYRCTSKMVVWHPKQASRT